ncbi:MAG: winged helix-turn-helix domain-containing protein, partial [Chloroflexota bacterium]|nr:winged helix-turn-helix domain-containing protein [Chloroflexota bacterium]
TGASPLQFDDLSVDVRARTAVRGGRTLQLSTREFDLLTFFLRHPNVVLSEDVIKEGVWGEDFFGQSNVVAVVVRALRRELEAEDAARLIQTIRGAGYVLRQA